MTSSFEGLYACIIHWLGLALCKQLTLHIVTSYYTTHSLQMLRQEGLFIHTQHVFTCTCTTRIKQHITQSYVTQHSEYTPFAVIALVNTWQKRHWRILNVALKKLGWLQGEHTCILITVLKIRPRPYLRSHLNSLPMSVFLRTYLVLYKPSLRGLESKFHLRHKLLSFLHLEPSLGYTDR